MSCAEINTGIPVTRKKVNCEVTTKENYKLYFGDK